MAKWRVSMLINVEKEGKNGTQATIKDPQFKDWWVEDTAELHRLPILE